MVIALSCLLSVVSDGLSGAPRPLLAETDVPALLVTACLLCLLVNIGFMLWVLYKGRGLRTKSGSEWTSWVPNASPAGVIAKADEADAVLRRIGPAVDNGVGAVNALRSAAIAFATSQFQQTNKQQKLLTQLATSVAAIIDHVEAASRLAGNEAVSELAGQAKEMAGRALADIGIRDLSIVVGQSFDGRRHVAIDRADSELPANSIVEVVRPGYVFSVDGAEVILRPASVVVSSGKPKAVAALPVTVPQVSPASESVVPTQSTIPKPTVESGAVVVADVAKGGSDATGN